MMAKERVYVVPRTDLFPEGAPHGFFCNDRDSYRPDAAKDAWERLKTFFAKHLKA